MIKTCYRVAIEGAMCPFSAPFHEVEDDRFDNLEEAREFAESLAEPDEEPLELTIMREVRTTIRPLTEADEDAEWGCERIPTEDGHIAWVITQGQAEWRVEYETLETMLG